MSSYYDTDLSYVHDTGFSEFAQNAAQMIVDTLNKKTNEKGLVIDLGCGSGVVAKALLNNHYDVLGIDSSKALIDIAKERAPQANFTVSSFFDVDFPTCIGVVSTSECLNYIVENQDHESDLQKLFQKVYSALAKGGLFIFDMIEPGTANDESHIFEHDDWSMFVRVREDSKTNILTREATVFKKVGEHYRRSHELHKAKLYPHEKIVKLLKEVGFDVDLVKQYNKLMLDEHHFGYLCKKQ